MIASELVSDAVFPVQPGEKLSSLQEKMREAQLEHFPVVRYTQYLGLLNEDDVAAQLKENPDALVESMTLEHISIYGGAHIYDVIQAFYLHQIDVLPVIDDKQHFLGMITSGDLLDYFAVLTGADQPGGIIVLELNNRDNSLAHIAQIVESDNAQIMSSYVRTFPDSTRIEVTLKLNRTEISSIVAAFLRYDYKVKATFNDQRGQDTASDRYEQLMNYLNM